MRDDEQPLDERQPAVELGRIGDLELAGYDGEGGPGRIGHGDRGGRDEPAVLRRRRRRGPVRRRAGRRLRSAHVPTVTEPVGPRETRVSGTLSRWTTPGSPTASTRSRRCSSSPRRTRTRPRAYRRAAETIRGAPVAGRASSCAPGGCASCAGSGPGSRRGCASWWRPGEIAELRELERELAPGLVGLGRYLGLTARRSVEIARALGVQHAGGVPRGRGGRAAARRARASGRRSRRSSLEALAREPEPRPRAGCCSTRRASSSAAIAERARTARRPATCAAGATRASSSRSCAPPPIRRRARRASPRCRRSSP